MNKHFILFYFIFRLNDGGAQTLDSSSNGPLYINVGQPCPDFLLKNIEYFPKSEVSIGEFRGEWLVLDFWNKNCGSCIKSFPELNRIKKQFTGKVQFFQIGLQDEKDEIRPLYRKLHDRLHLELPCAFDSIICRRMDIIASPHAIFIDPQGIVRGVTSFFTVDDMAKFVAGERPDLIKTYWRDHEDSPEEKNEQERAKSFRYSDKLPYLVLNNGGSDTSYLFRSLLAKYNPLNKNIAVVPQKIYPLKNGRLEVIKGDLKELYFLAYIGRSEIHYADSLYALFSQWPVLEIVDSSAFKSDYLFKYRYDYSLTIPASKASESYLMRVMQNDLHNYFGYDVNIEIRKMPYWEVTISDSIKTKLRSSGGPSSINHIDHFVDKINNYPIREILARACEYGGVFSFFSNERGIVQEDYFPVDNKSRINFNIDIVLDGGNCLIETPSAVREALETNGFNFKLKYREMKCLIIRDSN